MEILLQKLKEYDKYLYCKKLIDGTIKIYRKSPFKNKFEVLSIRNQYIGSSNFILKKIALMDSTRRDFIMSSIIHNKKIRERRFDDMVSRDIARFMHENEKIII